MPYSIITIGAFILSSRNNWRDSESENEIKVRAILPIRHKWGVFFKSLPSAFREFCGRGSRKSVKIQTPKNI